MADQAEAAQLRESIAALEAQRPVLGDAVVEPALMALREKLAALETAAPEQQRKHVTVLFADVVGFTAMSETMDAEDVADIMNQAWQLLDATIVAHGGRIDKHIGDAVMALWGVEAAREDDPEQAIRAALAMQHKLADFCVTAGRDAPLKLSMRIGLHTGPVLLGQMGTTGEFTAIGDTVNLASRLEEAATVGTVLISHNTFAHVRGLFDAWAREPLSVKGKSEPVRVYEIRKARPRTFRHAARGIEGIQTRMIGRDSELLALQNAFFDAAEGGEARLVTIVGEAGVGKSRLLHEFDRWLEQAPLRATNYKGRATAATEDVPFSLFRDLFAFQFDIRDGDSTATALEKFRAGFRAIPLPGGESADDFTGGLAPGRADITGHWLGFDFSQSPAVARLLGSQDFASVAKTHLTRYFRAATAVNPVAIFLEDIHWADDSSLDLANHLLEALPKSQLLLIGVARHALFERRAQWGQGITAASRIELKPLSRRANRALVAEILQPVEDVPDSLRELVVNAAEGNPYYTEELINMFIDQGVIVRQDGAIGGTTPGSSGGIGQWRIRGDRLAEAQVPATLTGLLQARLDGLPAAESDLLQQAAVVGRLFWDGVVAELSHKDLDAIRPLLQSSQARELIFQRDHSAFDGTDEFVFKHNLLREVAYERVLLKRRRALHGRVARWLENHAGERVEEHLELIARHYELAGEPDKAAAYLLRAGQGAFQANAYAEACRMLERARALMKGSQDGNDVVAETALVLGRALAMLGDFDESERALQQALAIGQERDDSRLQAEALAVLGNLALWTRADSEAARALVMDQALPLARSVGGRTLVLVLLEAGAIYWEQGALGTAEQYAEESLHQARAIGDATQEAMALNLRANIAADQGNPELSRQRHDEVLTFARRIGNLEREAVAMLNLGNVLFALGEYEASRSHTLTGITLLRELGRRQGEALALSNLALADIELGHAAAAQRHVRRSLQMALELDVVPHIYFAVTVAANVLAVSGDRERGLSWLWLVNDQPRTSVHGRRVIATILERLGATEEELAAARATAAVLDLDQVIAAILEGNEE